MQQCVACSHWCLVRGQYYNAWSSNYWHLVSRTNVGPLEIVLCYYHPFLVGKPMLTSCENTQLPNLKQGAKSTQHLTWLEPTMKSCQGKRFTSLSQSAVWILGPFNCNQPLIEISDLMRPRTPGGATNAGWWLIRQSACLGNAGLQVCNLWHCDAESNPLIWSANCLISQGLSLGSLPKIQN